MLKRWIFGFVIKLLATFLGRLSGQPVSLAQLDTNSTEPSLPANMWALVSLVWRFILAALMQKLLSDVPDLPSGLSKDNTIGLTRALSSSYATAQRMEATCAQLRQAAFSEIEHVASISGVGTRSPGATSNQGKEKE